jgi:hypothetical protein
MPFSGLFSSWILLPLALTALTLWKTGVDSHLLTIGAAGKLAFNPKGYKQLREIL